MMLRLLEPDDPRVPMLEKRYRDALALQEEEKAKVSHRRNNETSIIRFSPYCNYCFELCTFEAFYMEILGRNS